VSPVDWGIYVKGGELVFRNRPAAGLPDDKQIEEEVLMLIDEIRIPGMHNAYNSMAAALAARAFEIRNEDIRDSLMAFQGVEHRLEHVAIIDGVEYINDSKATNINATWYALSSYDKPIIWIAGGRGDSNDYSALDELVQKNVKEIIAIGEEADAIFNHFCLAKRCLKENSLESAVFRAREDAESGDIVLFTPACKSFDMFMNYEHRGEVYKDIVSSLK
jgi:UDP-N-acetylmuramoylalanine--D-glutamate ligase